MATNLTKPTLISTPAFDATQPHTFTFAIYGSSPQIIANKLVIRNQTTNEVVYTEKQESFRYEHVVNADSLKNNTYYNATLTTFDASGNESPASVPIQFWCYTTPTIEFTNLPVTNIINNASFNFEFTYNQVEGEKLNGYVINLYDASKGLLSTSGETYVANGTPPYTGSYLFSGLENAATYYIEIVATTINQTVITTGLYNFTVKYERPDIFTLMELVNNCNDGYITISSNIILIEGEGNPDPPKYINGQEVDLTDKDSWVKWENGYNITGDFLARVWFRNPNPHSTLIKYSNAKGQTIEVIYREGYENVNAEEQQAYIEVHVASFDSNVTYYIFSNYIPILPPDQHYCFWLRRVNNIYQAELGKA